MLLCVLKFKIIIIDYVWAIMKKKQKKLSQLTNVMKLCWFLSRKNNRLDEK